MDKVVAGPPGSGSRPTKLTGRAAVLAVVICAIALSLAYPVREYIAQRQQIDQLLAQQQVMFGQVKNLQGESARLSQPWYIEQRARDELHFCFPHYTCYEVIDGQAPFTTTLPHTAAVVPWYDRLWRSVQRADSEQTR